MVRRTLNTEPRTEPLNPEPNLEPGTLNPEPTGRSYDIRMRIVAALSAPISR
jgi:hypothetical protein